MTKYIKTLFKKCFSEQHESIVKHKLSRSLVCAENLKAKKTVLKN